jgi:hypothetical protein
VSRRRAARRLHAAPVPPPPPRVSYLALENAKRVEHIQIVAKKMVIATITWATRNPDYIGDQFAALWGTTRWLCGLKLPETVEEFWSGAPILELKPMALPPGRDSQQWTAHRQADGKVCRS